MKEKELSANDKRRRTTLRKKSIEELVNIILRKDDVERRLNKSVDTFKKLQVTNEKRIETLKDSLDKSEESRPVDFSREHRLLDAELLESCRRDCSHHCERQIRAWKAVRKSL